VVFANNAVICDRGTAILADGLGNAVLRRNAIRGRLTGVQLDDDRFYDAGPPEALFMDAFRHDFWPKPDSALRGQAAAEFAVEFDFNITKRMSPFDVGAFETEGQPKNPGWPIQAGFKK
jgi:hypothetical protein